MNKDCIGETVAEVVIDANGQKLWVNVDGRCELRVVAPRVVIDDARSKPSIDDKWISELVVGITNLIDYGIRKQRFATYDEWLDAVGAIVREHREAAQRAQSVPSEYIVDGQDKTGIHTTNERE